MHQGVLQLGYNQISDLKMLFQVLRYMSTSALVLEDSHAASAETDVQAISVFVCILHSILYRPFQYFARICLYFAQHTVREESHEFPLQEIMWKWKQKSNLCVEVLKVSSAYRSMVSFVAQVHSTLDELLTCLRIQHCIRVEVCVWGGHVCVCAWVCGCVYIVSWSTQLPIKLCKWGFEIAHSHNVSLLDHLHNTNFVCFLILTKITNHRSIYFFRSTVGCIKHTIGFEWHKSTVGVWCVYSGVLMLVC